MSRIFLALQNRPVFCHRVKCSRPDFAICKKWPDTSRANLSDERTLAYAIYVLTREGVVTTNYILNLRDYLDKNYAHQWENDLAGVYLAAALKLLHKDSEAQRLISQYRIENRAPQFCGDFYQALGANAQYLSVIAREFPERLKKISAYDVQTILSPIGEGQFNTLSAAYAVAALKSYSHAVGEQLPEQSIIELTGHNGATRLVQGSEVASAT